MKDVALPRRHIEVMPPGLEVIAGAFITGIAQQIARAPAAGRL